MSRNMAAVGRRLCLAAMFVGSLAGCSSVPDAVNPVSWYRGVEGWFDDGEKQPAQADAKTEAAKPVPGSDKPFPSLSTVPDRPPEPSTAAERKQAARSLAADREQARYTDQEIRRQTDEPANRPRPPEPARPPPQTASAAPSAGPSPSPPPAPPALPQRSASASGGSPPVQAPVRPPASARLPSRNVPRIPPSEMPQIPAAPPPPPMVSATPPVAQPPAAAPVPPPAARPAAPARRGAGQPPNGQLTFGPPPADIAIVQQGDGAPRGRRAAPPYARRDARQAVTAMPDAPSSSRFPARAPFAQPSAPEAGGAKLATIYFGKGSAKIGSKDATAIRRAVETFRAQGGGALKVVGHASSRTANLAPSRHEIVNLSISLDRANAVAREIVRLGVDPSAVSVVAMSDSQPVYYEVMPAGEAGNRRVEITIEN